MGIQSLVAGVPLGRPRTVWLIFKLRHYREAAWVAAKAKNSYLSAQFRRLAAARGTKRAVVAVAHTMLTIGYHLLQRGTTCQDLGANYFDQRHILRTTKRLVKRLEALGHRVTLDSPLSTALNRKLSATS